MQFHPSTWPHSHECILTHSTDAITATPPLRPVQLATSYLTTAHTHHTAITTLHPTISTQHTSLSIAHSSLQLNTLSLTSLFSSLSPTFAQSLTAQETLLNGVGADLRLVSKVRVGREFLSAGVRRAIERGEVGERCLGDYVSAGKMRGVEEGCRRTHGEFIYIPFHSYLHLIDSSVCRGAQRSIHRN